MASKNNRSLSLRRKEEELADMEAKTQEIRDWIEGILKEKLPKTSFRDTLMDGVVLCKLANGMKAGCIKKFHKKPRMLMMKMENIAFFLTACKSRFNIPQAVIFAPTDIHDDSDPTSMRKVINVLLLMKQEMGGGPSAAEAAADLELREKEREEELKRLEEEDIRAGVLVEAPKPVVTSPRSSEPVETPRLSDSEDETPASTPAPVDDEPDEIMPPPTPKGEAPKPEARYEPKHVEPKHVEPRHVEPRHVEPSRHVEPKHVDLKSSTTATNGSAHQYDYYVKDKPTDHLEVQSKILQQILAVIDSELSVESKLKLISSLNAHVNSVQHKVMSASNDELRSLAHEMGLGSSMSEVPSNKDRQWYVDFILKHGKAQ